MVRRILSLGTSIGLALILLAGSPKEVSGQPVEKEWEWKALGTPSQLASGMQLYSGDFLTIRTGWVVGYPNVILKTTGGGQTWTSQPSGLTENIVLHDVQFKDSGNGWIVGGIPNTGKVLYSYNGGDSWSTQLETSEQLFSVYFVSTEVGWAVGDYGTIFKTMNGGQSWVDQSYNTTSQLLDVYFKDSQIGWIVGGSGLILHTKDGGQTWEEQNSGVTSSLKAVHFVAYSQTGWAVGYSGMVGADSKILKTTDGGQTWTQQVSNTKEPLNDVHFEDLNEGWAVGKNGTAIYTKDGGTTWQVQSTETTEEIESISFINRFNAFAVSKDGSVLTYDDPITSISPTTLHAPQDQELVELPVNLVWQREDYVSDIQTNVQVSSQADFSDSLKYESAYPDSILILSQIDTFEVGKRYYWRVRRQARENENLASDWVSRSFKVEVAPPVLAFPQSGSMVGISDKLEWNIEQSPDDYNFNVHISSVSDFSDTLFFEPSFQDSELLLDQSMGLRDGKTYYWKVRRQGTANDEIVSSWESRSFVFNVEAPILAGPENGGALELPGALTWSEEPNPDNYNFNVHLSTNAEFTDTLRYESAYSDSSLALTQVDSLELNKTYHWRVRRQGVADQGLVSEWISGEFSIAVEALTITGPENGTELETPIRLEWNDNGKSNYRYHFQLSTQSDFRDTLRFDSTLTLKEKLLTQSDSLQVGETYYWRVRKQGTVDKRLIGDWTSGNFVATVHSPVLLNPAVKDTLENLPVTLVWSPGNKEEYQVNVEVSADPDFTSFIEKRVFEDDLGFPEAMGELNLPGLSTNESYYWRAQRQGKINRELASEWVSREFFVEPDFMRLTVDSAFTSLPNYVNAIFHATDLDGRGINTLKEEDFLVFDNENDLLTGAESSYNVNRIEQIPTNTKVVMLLDNSTSLGTKLDQVQEAAIQFIRNKTDNQEVAVYTFSDGSQEIIDFTSDTTALIQAVNSITLGFNSTDLYGSLINMYDKWENSFSLSQINQGFLVVFSDGDDTAGRSTLSEAESARGDKQVFTVGFGDVDPATLDRLGNAGSFYEQNDISRLTALFEDVQNDLIKLSESFYWFNFGSPKRADDEFQVSVGVADNNNFGSDATFSVLYNSGNFYSIKSQIYVNSTAQNPDGINSLSIPADTTLNIEILSPFNYQIYPYSFKISDPSKLLIEPVTSRGNVFTYQLKANGSEGDQISVEITDNVTSALGSKTLTVNFTASNSAAVTPDQVTLASPEDGTTNTTETPAFTWHKVNNALTYRLQVSETEDFSVAILDSTVSDTVVTSPSLGSEKMYYWRVQSENRGMIADWSDTWSFTTTLSAPDAVVLRSPLGPELESGSTVSFSWEEAGANIDEYQFQLTDNGDFTDPLIDSLTAGTTLDLDDLADGTEYSWRIKAINAAGEGPFSDVATFTYTYVAGKPGIVNLLSPDDGATGQPLELELAWNEEDLATSYQVQIAADRDFISIFKDSTVADTVLLIEGLAHETTSYWRVRAINANDGINGDWSSTFRFTTESEIKAPTEVTAEIARTFGDAAGPQDYRLVALPGNISESLAAVLTGEAGVEWQAYWDNGSEEDYLVKYDGGNTFTMASGNGFWVTSKEAFEYSETIPAVELSSQNQALIPLHEGWNIISNPLDIDVSWNEVQAANGGGLQPVWSFEGSFSEPAGFTSAKTGEAFYFLNDQGLEELAVPYVSAGAKVKAKSKHKQEQQEIRLITLVEDKETSSSRVTFVAPEKNKRPDAVAPPGGFEGASLRFAADAKKQKSKRSSAFARIYREFNTEGQSFKMRLSAAPGEPVMIKVEGWDASVSPEIALIEEQTGLKHDLSSKQEIIFTPEEETTTLLFIVGDAAYMEQQQSEYLPDVVQVMHNFPNPFTSSTNLRFALPEQSRIRLDVYDVLGRRVATLLNEDQPAGTHTIQFDASGRASGVYISVFTIGDKRFIEKMMLIK